MVNPAKRTQFDNLLLALFKQTCIFDRDRHLVADHLRQIDLLLIKIVRTNATERQHTNHPLANREFLFPFASVVQVDPRELPDCLGPSLVVTCISNDAAFRARFVSSPLVDRLNFGPLSTTQIGWDQPHEGNLFDHLYARRAIQRLA